MRLKKEIILIAVVLSVLFALLFYVHEYENSIQCKSVAMYSVDRVAQSELDGLRFNISRLVIGDSNIHEAIQKNSLLLNADEKSMTIVSQLRIANSNGIWDRKIIEKIIEENLNKISAIYGFAVLNTSIECIAPPSWHLLILPIVLILLILSFSIKNRFDSL